MDRTAVSGTAGTGSIPVGGAIDPLRTLVFGGLCFVMYNLKCVILLRL